MRAVGDHIQAARGPEGRAGHSIYVLITPARNEVQFIERTIRSVVKQTTRPAKWIIVSDGSTDGTDAMVSKYAAEHEWIELVRMPERRERHFAGKVHAFNAGYARVKDVNYQMIGSLDADISFDEDYFPFLLRKLAEDPALGLVGTPFKGSETYDYRLVSIEPGKLHLEPPSKFDARVVLPDHGEELSVAAERVFIRVEDHEHGLD